MNNKYKKYKYKHSFMHIYVRKKTKNNLKALKINLI